MTDVSAREPTAPGGAHSIGPARRVVHDAVGRLLDLSVACLVLLVASPLLLLIYLVIRLTSPGSGFFRQTRVGMGGRPFVMYKFRTMQQGCDHSVHQEYVRRLLSGQAEPEDGLYKLVRDPRVTPIGRFLRRSSLDELPQLFNVLRGEMSVVGPRPSLPWEVEDFPEWASCRFAVRPGLTGLWQVSGRNRLTMLQGLRLDVEYVARRSLAVDLLILLRTVPALLGRGAR
jgi:lipopolysaccharide/colanic/teichoic acid biosynthesis glycosyltransferase